MAERHASCSCGQLRVTVEGDPIRVSMCHCLNCQRRSGSTYAIQARFREDDATITGESTEFVLTGDEGTQARFQFCPRCGATVFYRTPEAGVIAIPVGAFADPTFPAPQFSWYESRRHAWVSVPDGAEQG